MISFLSLGNHLTKGHAFLQARKEEGIDIFVLFEILKKEKIKDQGLEKNLLSEFFSSHVTILIGVEFKLIGYLFLPSKNPAFF